MRLSGFSSKRFVIALAGATMATPAFADGGVASGGRDSGSDGRAASAGTSGTGGRAGSGGTGGRAGSGGGPADASSDGSESREGGAGQALPGTSAVSCGPLVSLPTSDAGALAPCTDICPLGSCVPAAALPGQGAQFATCANPADKCLPSFLIESALSVRFKACHSVAKAEGRCLPKCLPLVSGQVFPVPRDTCLDAELCIPCFNPIDGTDNGVCSYACDPGPTEPPVTFPGCCNGTGVCLDGTILPSTDRARLQAESCGANKLCAPKNPSAPFACEVLGAEPAPPPESGGATSAGTGGAAPQKDGGTGGTAAQAAKDDSGCGCRVAMRDDGAGSFAAIAAIGAMILGRRRRMVR